MEKFILFYLGEEFYALPALAGNQFIEFSNLAVWPHKDRDIDGLIYHNGHIITVIDLKNILKIKSQSADKSKTCLTFEVGGYYYGLLVDKGGETMPIKKIFNDRQKKIFKRYFVLPDNKQKVSILDIDDILSQISLYD